MGNMTKNFDRSEFLCPCGCGLDNIDESLVEELQRSRDAVGVPYVIASGCRCHQHNADIYHRLYPNKSVNLQSPHLPSLKTLKCRAVDITILDMDERKKILTDVIPRFRRVGIARTFIHLDNETDLPQGVYVY